MQQARVLVVDDEARVLNYIVTVLREHGYDVYSANDASAALQIAEQLSCRLNLLITDVVMPGMAGDELVRWIRRMCPYVDVLATTGGFPESKQGLVNCTVLKKPFTPELLLEVVRDILAHQIH